MTTSPRPRPYVVRWKDDDGNEHDEHVLAYDLQEAVIATSVAASGRGHQAVKLIAVTPDVEALAAEGDGLTEEGLRFAREMGRKVRDQ
jgi:hypothetical protein